MGHDMSRQFVETARDGDIETLQRLIDEGADVNGKSDGITPLIAAAVAGKTIAVKFLLGSLANVEVRDDDGYTVITLALDNGQKAVAELLAEHSTNVTDPRLSRGELWLREEFEKIYNNVKDPDSKPSRDLLEKVINGFVSGELKKLEGLEKRSVSEVYWEHILLCYIGDIPLDIKRNYSEDVELSLAGTHKEFLRGHEGTLSHPLNDRLIKGHAGIKQSGKLLNDKLPTTKYDIVGTVVGQAGNWVTERWGYHDVKNKLQVVDGIDTFLIEGAKITKKMINYTVENHVDSREEYEKKIGLRVEKGMNMGVHEQGHECS